MIRVTLNYSTKFTAIVVVAFTKKRKRQISKQDRAASRANIQPFYEYFSVRRRIILILLKKTATKQQAEQTHNLLVTALVFVD